MGGSFGEFLGFSPSVIKLNIKLKQIIDLFEQIKKERIISEDIKNMLATPRSLIDENSTLLGSSVPKEMLYYGNIFRLVFLYKKSKLLYKCISFILKFFFFLQDDSPNYSLLTILKSKMKIK